MLRQFADRVRYYNQPSSGTFKQKYPWGIDQSRVNNFHHPKDTGECKHTRKPDLTIAK